MTTLQKYLLKETILISSGLILLLVLILGFSRFYIISKTAIEAHLSVLDCLKLVYYFLPHYMGIAVPFSLYWATYHTVRTLSKRGEIAAMFSMGISPFSLIRLVLLLGVLLCVYDLAVLGWEEPQARYNYRTMIHDIESGRDVKSIGEKSFVKIDNYTIYVGSIDRGQSSYSNLFINGSKDGSLLTITAASGKLVQQDDQYILVMQRGTWLQVSAEDPNTVIENTSFDSVDLAVAEFPGPFREIGGDEQEFSLIELYTNQNNPPAGTLPVEMKIELWRKLALILSPLFLPLAAFAFGNFKLDFDRPLQVFLAIGFPLCYFELLNICEILTLRANLSPELLFGAILFAFASFSVVLFRRS